MPSLWRPQDAAGTPPPGLPRRLLSRERGRTPHCAVYLETAEQHHRKGSIPDHAFRTRHLQGFPAEFSRWVPKESHVAHQGRVVRPSKELALDTDALSAGWLPPAGPADLPPHFWIVPFCQPSILSLTYILDPSASVALLYLRTFRCPALGIPAF